MTDATLAASESRRVKLVEVGPRDGLQNEEQPLPPEVRVELIRRLARAGLAVIEAGAFVPPKWVPQMANTDRVLAGLAGTTSVDFPVLVPNMKGLEAAIAAGAKEIAVFGAASETFSQKNINCSIDESLSRFRLVCDEARARGLRVRGYVSCVLGCPYEGDVPPSATVRVARALHELGCYEVSLGDTIGVGTVGRVRKLLRAVSSELAAESLAVHFHDTYGQALANILVALEEGVTVIDSSVAGLGGCPYARGASGNVATEDVLYLLDGLGVTTGVDLQMLAEAGWYICGVLGKPPVSRVSQALQAKTP